MPAKNGKKEGIFTDGPKCDSLTCTHTNYAHIHAVNSAGNGTEKDKQQATGNRSVHTIPKNWTSILRINNAPKQPSKQPVKQPVKCLSPKSTETCIQRIPGET